MIDVHGSTLACEYLAHVGYQHLAGTGYAQNDPDIVHTQVLRLLQHRVKSYKGAAGVRWVNNTYITWPDRVPGLITWAGQQHLDTLIRARQKAIRDLPTQDPLTIEVPMLGSSGIDDRYPDAIDIGFSLQAHKMEAYQRPALELLAIIGLETVPIVSHTKRSCGFVHAGIHWQFDVPARSQPRYHRWGTLRRWGTV